MFATASLKTTPEQQALGVFQSHVAAFTAGNLDAVLNDFSADAVVITPEGVFEGRAQIRTLYEGLLAEFGVIDRGDSPGLNIDVLHVQQDMLFIVWHAESRHQVFPFGTDTFICKGGKFVRQTIAFSPTTQRSCKDSGQGDVRESHGWST